MVSRRKAYTSELQFERPEDARIVEAIENIKNRARSRMAKPEDMSRREREHLAETMKLSKEAARSMHRRGDKDMQHMGDVPVGIFEARIRESGDPTYWTTDTKAKLAREGLLTGRR